MFRLFGELSKLDTTENFHYLRFRLEGRDLQGTMVRFDPERNSEAAWTEPDRFEVKAKGGHLSARKRSRQPEPWEHAALKADHGADPLAGEREDE